MNGMSLARFQCLLDAYGGDPQRWPDPERSAALHLLNQSASARVLQQHAQQLDELLDKDLVAPPDAALQAQILRTYVAPRTWRNALRDLWRELGGWQLAGPAFAASLALGVSLPLWLEDSAADLPSEDLLAALQLAEDIPELNP